MPSPTSANKPAWWKTAIFYEIAAISFQDSNGDGKGDLRGLINRIPYLAWLGIDVVWLTPIYPSPFHDFGYDISDYCDVDPVYGTLAGFDELLGQLHARNIRLILDYVPNHTSVEHPWFRESRASRHNPKRDWYVWADPAPDGGPPNNWLSRFGGSGWEWDETSSQYYYHAFLKEQPDLNWRNKHVRDAMAEVLRFWLKRGVDGFRMDACAVLAEDGLLRDDPPDPDADAKTPPPSRLKRIFTDDRPESMLFIEDVRQVIDEFPDRVLAGEVQGSTDRIGHFYYGERPRLHLPLNYVLLDTEWNTFALQAAIDAYLNVVPAEAWPDWASGGHDKRRVAGRIGQEQARILALLLMTLKGTPFLFAGDELGMDRVQIPADCMKDPFGKQLPGYNLSRDPERVPISWKPGPHGGFTTGTPWLPLRTDRQPNVETLQADPHSILNLYRSAIALRRQTPQLREGELVRMRAVNDIILFKRTGDGVNILVALNIANQPRKLPLAFRGKLLLSTDMGKTKACEGPLILTANEGIVVKLDTDLP